MLDQQNADRPVHRPHHDKIYGKPEGEKEYEEEEDSLFKALIRHDSSRYKYSKI